MAARKTPKREKPLTIQERLYCHAYLKTMNNEKACEEVGISSGTGTKWRKTPRVAAFLEHLMRQKAAEMDLTTGYVVQRLMLEAEGDTHSGRVQALIALGRRLGMFTDNQNLSGSVSVEGQVHIYLPDNGREDKGKD